MESSVATSRNDLPSLHLYVHFIDLGTSSDPESCIQDVERAGRDNINMYAVLWYTMKLLQESSDKLTKFAQSNDTFRRKQLFSQFDNYQHLLVLLVAVAVMYACANVNVVTVNKIWHVYVTFSLKKINKCIHFVL